MPERITEPSLYRPIIQLFEEVARRYGVRVTGVEEVGASEKYEDVILYLDGYKLFIQVKIDSVSKLMKDIVDTYPVARRHDADLLGILFPSDVRGIRPEQLEAVKQGLQVSRALILTRWFSGDLEAITLLHVIEDVIRRFVEFRRTLIPVVDYLTIAKVAREAVEDLSIILRGYMGVQKYFDMAQAIIGRFDLYRTLLEEFVDREEVMKTYIADIIAYLVILQLLFAHIVSVRTRGGSILPEIGDPFSIPDDVIERLMEDARGLCEEYERILGSLPYLLGILLEVKREDVRPVEVLGRYIYAIRVIRPEHVREELLGRIYQESLPHETRKNLGAFFTRPRAAKMLAELAIDRWDEKVLDPACGSGTLLVSAYHAKMERAREAGLMDEDECHKRFIEEHVFGIDIMQFAKELTTINLALQNLRVKAAPRIYFGDGIAKMFHAVAVADGDEDPLPTTLVEYLEDVKREYERFGLPREGIDVVIMNPPFTRRERIPEAERKKLETMLGHIIRGKVGYWAYFFAAADNVIKLGGKLASVTPEEFFAGASAESIRRFLLLGEVYNSERDAYVKEYARAYVPKVIVKSAAEIAFSERAHYRDYLVILEKRSSHDAGPTILVILNKRLDEIADMEQLLRNIRGFMGSGEDFMVGEGFTARKIHNIGAIVYKHVGNLKPLVGLNTIEAQKLVLELLEDLSDHPTLRDYEEEGLIRIRDYNPGQYITRGVEEYARRLFISRYKGRGKISFTYVGESDDAITLAIRGSKSMFNVSKTACIRSLRAVAGVKHIDVTGEEEYAIIDPRAIPADMLKMAGLTDRSRLRRAAEDIRQAYSGLAGNILLVRRARLTSPNVYWLTFFSTNRIIGPSAPMICMATEGLGLDGARLLALYLNSSLALLQLLAYIVETEGAYVALQGDQVWSHIHIPRISELPPDITRRALNTFNEVGKMSAPSLYQRIKDGHVSQRRIDEESLRMLGLNNWASKLDSIYDAILRELNIMKRILEESERRRSGERAHSRKRKPPEEAGTPLDKWL